MNCKQIIENYLVDNGFDGLCHQGECSCKMGDNEFMPCGEPHMADCEPAYIGNCDSCEDSETCVYDYCLKIKKEE